MLLSSFAADIQKTVNFKTGLTVQIPVRYKFRITLIYTISDTTYILLHGP